MDLSHLEETPLDVWCKLIDIQYLSIICQRYCRGILPHSPVCVYWSTRNSANGVRCSNNCETFVASTDQQTKYYAVYDSFSELHCAKPYSAVQLKTVYSDFCRDGYLANTFELQVITKPSLISTLEQDRNNDIHCVHPAISEVSHATAKMSTCAMPLVQCSTHSDEVFTLQYADDSCTPVSSRQYCREVSPSIQSRYSSMAIDRARIGYSLLLCVHQPIFCQKPLHHIRHSSQRTKSQYPNAIGTGYVSLLLELSALQPRLGLVTFMNNQKYSIPVFCQPRNAKQTTPTFLIWTNDLFYGLMAIWNNLSQHFTL